MNLPLHCSLPKSYLSAYMLHRQCTTTCHVPPCYTPPHTHLHPTYNTGHNVWEYRVESKCHVYMGGGNWLDFINLILFSGLLKDHTLLSFWCVHGVLDAHMRSWWLVYILKWRNRGWYTYMYCLYSFSDRLWGVCLCVCLFLKTVLADEVSRYVE